MLTLRDGQIVYRHSHRFVISTLVLYNPQISKRRRCLTLPRCGVPVLKACSAMTILMPPPPPPPPPYPCFWFFVYSSKLKEVLNKTGCYPCNPRCSSGSGGSSMDIKRIQQHRSSACKIKLNCCLFRTVSSIFFNLYSKWPFGESKLNKNSCMS